MARKIFAILLLSLTVAACDSSSTDTNSNSNNAPKVNAVTPTPVPSPSPEPSSSPLLKAGDKVKVANNGALSEATVVSVDERSGKVTVRLQGESKDKLVSISDVTRQ